VEEERTLMKPLTPRRRAALWVLAILGGVVGAWLALGTTGFDRCDKQCISASQAHAFIAATGALGVLWLGVGAAAIVTIARGERRGHLTEVSLSLLVAAMVGSLFWFIWAGYVGEQTTT
jgi:hypothetical protein